MSIILYVPISFISPSLDVGGRIDGTGWPAIHQQFAPLSNLAVCSVQSVARRIRNQ
jgi:hypothetical protein